MGYILGFLCHKWQHKWGMQGFYPCLMLFYERLVSRYYDHTYVIKVGAHPRDSHEKKYVEMSPLRIHQGTNRVLRFQLG